MPASEFVDPEIKALTRGQREEELALLTALLEKSYPHLAEKKRRFGVEVPRIVQEHRPAILRATNRYQYMNNVDRILLEFHDGHLITRGFRRTFRNTWRSPVGRPRGRPRPRPVQVGLGLTLRYVEGQVAVVRVRAGSPAARAGLRPGDVILLAGGAAVLSRLGSSLRWRGWARLAAGLQLAASRVVVSRPWYPDTPLPTESYVIRRGARRLHVTLTGARVPPREERLLRYHEARCGVGVLRVGTFTGSRRVLWKRLAAQLALARQARALILDLRGNRGGSAGLAMKLCSHLVTRKVVAGHHRYLRTRVLAEQVRVIPSLAPSPADPRWTVWVPDRVKPAARPLILPKAVLVDELCASACEGAARVLQAAPDIRLYGRATAGSSGLPVTVDLPHSKLMVSLPSWQARAADGRLIEGNGVWPHVRVPLRLADLRAGRDATLERALHDLCDRLSTSPTPRPR